VPLQLDPVTLEVMSRKLAAITDEMYFSVQRAARSSYVKEAADFATALLDPQGDVFAYPPSATFAFLIDTDFKATLDAVPHVEPGDVIITNDPYASGGVSTHLSDLHLFRPYFAGNRVIAWGWSFVHCADIGGAVPGSVSPALTSIFMEGFRIPPLKLMKRGEPNADLFALLHLNSRMGELNLGDLRAMRGALETGNRRIAELVAKQGAETLLAAESGLQDYTARKARDVLRKIPDGVFEFWDFLDDDMVTGIPIRVRLRMTVDDGLIDLDMSGGDPQVRSAYNVPTMGRRTYWLTFRLTTVLTTFDPLMPHNAGLYRGITVNVPRGSVLRAEFPDAVSVRNSVPYRLFDCISGAIMQAAPELMPAATGGTLVTFSLSEIPRRCLARSRGDRTAALRHGRAEWTRRRGCARQQPRQHAQPSAGTGRGDQQHPHPRIRRKARFRRTRQVARWRRADHHSRDAVRRGNRSGARAGSDAFPRLGRAGWHARRQAGGDPQSRQHG